MTEKIFSLRDDKICEYGKPISNERILKLLNESEFVRADLQNAENRVMNTKITLDYYSTRCLRLENGIKDCIAGHDNLKKFAKKMGI